MKKNKKEKAEQKINEEIISEESVVITKPDKKAIKKAKKEAKKASKEQKEVEKFDEQLEKLAQSAEELKNNPAKRAEWVNKYFKKQFGKANPMYMNLVQMDYQTVIERATKLIGIDSNLYEEYHQVIAPDSLDNSRSVRYRFDKTADNKNYTLYYDQVFMTVLFFGQENLFIYRANVDHLTGDVVMEKANEFSYFDIVSIETSRTHDRINNPKYLQLSLNLNLLDGEEFNLNLRNQRLYASQGRNYIFLILSIVLSLASLLVLGIVFKMWMIGVYTLGLILVGVVIEIFRHKHKLHIECPFLTPHEQLIIGLIKEKVRESHKS